MQSTFEPMQAKQIVCGIMQKEWFLLKQWFWNTLLFVRAKTPNTYNTHFLCSSGISKGQLLSLPLYHLVVCQTEFFLIKTCPSMRIRRKEKPGRQWGSERDLCEHSEHFPPTYTSNYPSILDTKADYHASVVTSAHCSVWTAEISAKDWRLLSDGQDSVETL